LINFNLEKGEYDGYSVFRNSDVDSYSVYVKKTLSINNDNFDLLTSKEDPSKSVKIKDQTILSDLSKKDNQGRSITKDKTTGSIDDIFKVYTCLAQNTKVEWGLARYESSKYAVYTNHITDEVAIPDIDLNLKNVNAFVHSHPRAQSTEWKERSSMGDSYRIDTKQHRRMSGSDWWTKKYAPLRYPFYAYFSTSENKRLYHIGLNKVSNVHTYKDFYFGVFNHK